MFQYNNNIVTLIMHGGATQKHNDVSNILDDVLNIDDNDSLKLIENLPSLDNPKQQMTMTKQEGQQLTNDEKNEIASELEFNVEQVKEGIKHLSVEDQLETLLNMMNKQLRKDGDMANQLRKDYCYSQTTFYKMLILFGYNEDDSSLFSEWYVKSAFMIGGTTEWTTIKSTFSFMRNWKGLLSLILFNVWMYTRAMYAASGSNTGGLGLIRQFLADNNGTIGTIKVMLSGQVGMVGKVIEYTGYAVDAISENLANWLNLDVINAYLGSMVNTIDNTEDYFLNHYGYDVIVLSFWGVIGFLGVAVFIWSIYVFSAMLKEVSEVEQFCAEELF